MIMPCNLVGRASAQVSNKTLVKLLTQEIVAQAMTAFLKSKNIAVDMVQRYGPQETQFWCGDLGISIETNPYSGELHVFAGGNRWAKGVLTQVLKNVDTTKMTGEITTHLTTVAGLLFQNLAKAKLAKLGAIESTSTAPNGALVIKMEI
jgi:hypothetical protein